MYLSSDNEIGLATNLGPKFQQAGITTKIIVWDHNWDHPEYPIAVLSNANANKWVAGSAFHCYGGSVSAQTQVHNAFPDKEIYFTECSGTNSESVTDFGNNLLWSMQNLFIGGTMNWARTVLEWNLFLDQNAGPQNGGCTNCRPVVTINYNANTLTYHSEYYDIAHLSKFVKPGAYRIGTTLSTSSSTFFAASFVNPDGSLVLVAMNSNGNSQQFLVNLEGICFTYTLPRGVATFIWTQ